MNTQPNLQRELGLPGAVLMGLGAILGTGVFVSIGIAAGVAGSAVILAIALAALLALCNAFSSAQLAADHPVSGGTYEYGYKYLNPALGFSAGWMFVCAKSASAATAALGAAGYFLHVAGLDPGWLVPTALFAVVTITVVVLTGIRRSNHLNALIVAITLGALLIFIGFGVSSLSGTANSNLLPFPPWPQDQGPEALLYATALMFVAFTGYGRIATLGEEVRAPRQTIPRAILLTLGISAVLYTLVAVVAVGIVGADRLAQATAGEAAPLEVVATAFGVPGIATVVAIGAVSAMLGVLLNLILGLSRVLLAMGRRRDVPGAFATIDSAGTTPYVSVIAIGLIVFALTAIGDVKTTWSFAAFTVLIYYAITNFAALRLPASARLYPRGFTWAGLAGCLGLAFWVEWQTWLVGLMVLGLGLVWHIVAVRKSYRRT